MAGGQNAGRQLGGEDFEQWVRRSAAEVDRQRRETLAAGRDAWEAATRSGQDLAAHTKQDLLALGRRVLDQQGPRSELRLIAPARVAAPTASNRLAQSRTQRGSRQIRRWPITSHWRTIVLIILFHAISAHLLQFRQVGSDIIWLMHKMISNFED